MSLPKIGTKTAAFNFKRRIEALREKLKKEHLDAILVATIEGNNKNVYYLSGFGGTAGMLAVSEHRVLLAVDGRYTLRAKEEAKDYQIVDVPVADRRVTDFSNYLIPVLDSLMLPSDARIGIEAGRVSLAMADGWVRASGRAFVNTEFFVEALRQAKDQEEIESIRIANDITSAVFEACLPRIVEGISERALARSVDIAHLEHGALAPSFDTIVASGPHSAIPHHVPTDRILRAGEPVTLDFGGLFEGGYCSDITRTVFVSGKEPDKVLKEIYGVVLRANEAARRQARVGMSWKEYDTVARKHITEAGYGTYFSHGLGHSIGLEVHDPYNYAEASFEVGTVMSNEPGIYIPGVGGVRIEDDIVIAEEGAYSLTTAPYLPLSP